MKRLWLPPLTAHMLSWAAFLGVVFWPFGFHSTTETLLPDGGWGIVFGQLPGALHAIPGRWSDHSTTDTGGPHWSGGLAGLAAEYAVGTCQASNVGVGSPLPGLLFCPNLVRRRIGDRLHWGVLFARSSGIDDLSDYCQHDQTGPGRRIGIIIHSKTKSLALHGGELPRGDAPSESVVSAGKPLRLGGRCPRLRFCCPRPRVLELAPNGRPDDVSGSGDGIQPMAKCVQKQRPVYRSS